MLRNRQCDAGNIYFLKAVSGQQIVGNIAGNSDHGDRIHISGGNTGDKVSSTGAGSGNDYAASAGSTGIAVSGMGSTLFMCRKNVGDPVTVLVECIVDVEDSTARITEYGVNALFNQALCDDF